MAVLLLIFVIRRARIEFNKAVQEAEQEDESTALTSTSAQDLAEKGEVTLHKRTPSAGNIPPVHSSMSPRLSTKLSREMSASNSDVSRWFRSTAQWTITSHI